MVQQECIERKGSSHRGSTGAEKWDRQSEKQHTKKGPSSSARKLFICIWSSSMVLLPKKKSFYPPIHSPISLNFELLCIGKQVYDWNGLVCSATPCLAVLRFTHLAPQKRRVFFCRILCEICMYVEAMLYAKFSEDYSDLISHTRFLKIIVSSEHIPKPFGSL